MSSSSTRVISNTSLEFLEQIGNSIELRGGYRTFSLQTVSSFHSDDTIEVPDVLNSTEALQFCGLQTNIADQLYQNWWAGSKPFGPGQGDSVIEYARSYIKAKSRARNGLRQSDDWDAALRFQGINEEVRRRILDPRFKNIRLTQSASEWALDTLNTAWEFLDGLDASLQKAKKRGDLRSASPNPSTKPSKAIKLSSSLTSALHGANDSLKLSTSKPMFQPMYQVVL